MQRTKLQSFPHFPSGILCRIAGPPAGNVGGMKIHIVVPNSVLVVGSLLMVAVASLGVLLAVG